MGPGLFVIAILGVAAERVLMVGVGDEKKYDAKVFSSGLATA